MKREKPLLLPRERECNITIEKALIGVNEFAAWRRRLVHFLRVEVDHLDGLPGVATSSSLPTGLKRRLSDRDDVILMYGD